jgi:acyl-CoA dehydrogenase
MSAMSDEHAALRDLVAGLAASDAGEAGKWLSLWTQVRELGLEAIGVAEESGGSGGTLTDLAVIVEALGEAGLGLPVIEVATARWVLGRVGTAANDARMPIVVLDNKTDNVVPDVPWGRHADLLIVFPTSGLPRAYDLTDRAVTVEPGSNVAGEPRDTVHLGDAFGRPLDGAPTAKAVRTRLGLLHAAALTGAIRGAYHRTRDHVRTREQFGAPLIKISAVASATANFRMLVLLAEAALARAVDALEGIGEYPDMALVAPVRIIAASNATEAARIAHQLHGAIGVTQEGGLYRLTTRLWAWQDAETSERDWSIGLGHRAVNGGEEVVWSELSQAF